MRVLMRCSKRGPKFHYPIGSEVDVPDKLAREWVKRGEAVKLGKPAAPPKPEPEPAPPATDALPVRALDLEPSTIAALEAAGVATVGGVKAHPDLTGIPGFGPATAKAIIAAVDQLEAEAAKGA